MTLKNSVKNHQQIADINMVVESLSSAPSSPVNGQIYYDSVLSKLRIYDLATTTWLSCTATNIVNADISASAAIALSKLASQADGTFVANNSGSPGAPTAITASAAKTLLALVKADVGLSAVTNDLQLKAADLDTDGTLAANSASKVPAQSAVKAYVDAQVLSARNGISQKNPVLLVVVANASVSTGASSYDGISVSAGDRILLTAQTTTTQNGIYTANPGGALTRATDSDGTGEIVDGSAVFVAQGTVYHDTTWAQTATPSGSIGSWTQTWVQTGTQTSYSAGTGIDLTGSTFSLQTPVAVANGGTGGGTQGAARTALNVPQRGYTADLGAISAGSTVAQAHGLGTADCVVQVRNKSTGAIVDIDIAIDSTNVTVGSAVAVSSGVLRVVVLPVQ